MRIKPTHPGKQSQEIESQSPDDLTKPPDPAMPEATPP